MFLRELFRTVEAQTGERIRELCITAPVDSYETYRAELAGICRRLGVEKVDFVDEPVAAAMGYGVNLKDRRRALVVDFGAGTLDLALVDLTARGSSKGSCEVLAKAGRAVGGNLVDRWILDEFSDALGYTLDPKGSSDEAFWYRLMLAEARRVKEAIFFNPSESFNVTPPEDVRRFESRVRGRPGAFSWDKARLVEVLKEHGMYRHLEECLDEILKQATARGVDISQVDEVLMVGGSTLLPEVYSVFERRFGRDRVRAWQPFEAVAYGACAYSAQEFSQSDFIVHDYAFLTYHPKTHEPEYTVIIPKGTRIPTKEDFWTRRLVPTCSLGEPESFFKLVVCELGRPDDGERTFAWDEGGNIHKLGGRDGDDVLVVPLNESNPTLGTLTPPHSPRDRSARLEISFGVNENRWLCANVRDLKTKKVLMKNEPVVRLL
jgi:molecular chaperone DnaK (HSP70)